MMSDDTMGQALPLGAALLGGAATMVVELAAARVLAPQLGVSIHTWSTLIGLVLTGPAVGGWVGGWLADRWDARRLLAAVLALAAAASLAGLPLADMPPPSWLFGSDNVGRMIGQSAQLVLAPSLALGAVAPVAARLAVREHATAGRQVGRVYALGAVGSIVGTLLTGFVSIDLVGARASIALAAAALAGLAVVALGRAGGRVALALRLAVVALPVTMLPFREALASRCTMESAYFCIKVEVLGTGLAEVRTLRLDKLLHSYYAPSEPTHLEYGYTRLFAALATVQAERRPPPRTLFIGGGGYTMPRYLLARYPGAEIDVIEIDQRVTEAAQRYLGLPADAPIRTFNEDARLFFIEQRAPGGYDLVFGDAFNDLSVPYHLTTREAALAVQAAMQPTGIYAINLVDLFPSAAFVRAELATLATVFPHVGVLLEMPASDLSPWADASWADGGGVRMTFVLLASSAPLPLDRLSSGPGVSFSVSQFTQLVGAGRTIVLTDDYAPVDHLTAPVFRSRRT